MNGGIIGAKNNGYIGKPNWPYRQRITIDHTKIDSDLTDFPVKVVLSGSNFDFGLARSDGRDVRFQRGGVNLAYERELHDAPNKRGVYHVKIPHVSASVDTSFDLLYGNPDAPDGEDKHAVWDSDFVMVNHMGDLTDSTINGNDGTNYGSTPVIDAQGHFRSFDGVDDYISIADATSLDITDNLTIDLHMKTNSASERQAIFQKAESGSLYSPFTVDILEPGSFRFFGYQSSSAHGLYGTQVAATTTQIVAACRFQNPTWNIFFNGATKASTDDAATLNSTSGAVEIGRRVYKGVVKGFLDGVVHEARLSKSGRSDAWIKATSETLHNTLLSIHGPLPKILTLNDILNREVMRRC